ncbi:lipopolysaccharide export LptBFGC system permease protein LptF [Kitasatospora sp. MAP12-15]|uniref:DUF6343 family protein n=1 Tax=unclassified Kitasatospora TaxID=2633591 RepID=UPI0024737D02|nr:DUF6343 family protein [Kitasatospora sp. MAP12-44]MDH6109156.1 lipopolysaccharide export LptBFGC system permease protein LptF [Kitasatospora sp. MAP12-44]
MRATTPRRWRSGTEPRFARSDLKLRFLLSVIFTPFFALITAAFAVFAAMAKPTSVPSRGTLVGFAIVCFVLTVVAAIDLWVVIRRRQVEL